MEKLKSLLVRMLVNTYFRSADPNLFGSKKRREDKEGIASEYKSMAKNTQSDIDELRSQNPFEGAAAKRAMAEASRNARQMQKRMLNTMGAYASPEAVIAAQGATNQAVGSAAGQIAAGAEANKQNQISNLHHMKTNQMGMYGNMGASAASERGSGWNTLFQGIDTLGKIASGGGQASKAMILSKALTGGA